jgi:hypothetical protein
MAKKTNKKPSKAAMKKAPKKSAKKAAAKGAKKPAKASAKSGSKPAKKPAKKKPDLLAPTRVSTGKGHTPAELGRILVDHVNAMAAPDTELWKQHFHPKFVSIEGTGEAWTGRKAVDAKCRAWMDAHTVHACKATGPFVGGTGFSVLYDMDVEAKDGSMPRTQMREVGVYTVKKGKVVQEEFMYAPM